MLLTIVKVSVSITVVETPFTSAVVIIAVATVVSRRRLLMLLTIAKVSVPIAVVEIPFTSAVVIVDVAAVEITGEASRLRELVLRRRVEVVVWGWIWEVRVNSRGTVVANGTTVGGVAKEPGSFVGLLHGVCGGRGCWASLRIYTFAARLMPPHDVIPWKVPISESALSIP